MNQIKSFINAMVIDYAHAATDNRVKWAFTSDTRADVVEMAVAVYRKNARRPYMVIFPQYNAIRNEINTVAAVILEGDDARHIMDGIENVNAFKVTGSPYDNDGMSIYTPAVEQEQEAPAKTEQTTETAQDATQAPTDAAPLQLETLAARLDRMTAAELVDLFAATSDPDTIDDQTDSALYDALHAINPRAYRVWMSTHADYTDDPASIAAADAADLARLRACYGV